MLNKMLKIASALASFAAISSMSTMCWYIFYQPQVPEELLDKK